MSTAIRDTEKVFNRQLESAKRRNEREIKSLNNAHEAMKSELKKANAEEVVDIQDTHHRQLNVEVEKKEKVLAELRDHQQKTTEMTDKQLKSLKQNAEKENAEIQNKLSSQRERINEEHQLFLEDESGRFEQAARNVNYDGKRRVEDKKLEMNELYSAVEGQNQEKLNKQSNDFNIRHKQEGIQYKKIKDDQDLQFKKERLSTNSRQQVEMAKITDTHNSHLEIRDGEFRKGLKQQDAFFETKYKDNLDRHNADHKVLEDKNKSVIASLKESFSKEITQAANRKDDDFYQFTSLKPKMKVFEDRVEITVDVPEHAKADLQLTTNIKEAVVSLNRRYSDANKTSDGSINKINKVESFSTRLNTGVVLDAKSVKASYEDGTMTYVIKKA